MNIDQELFPLRGIDYKGERYVSKTDLMAYFDRQRKLTVQPDVKDALTEVIIAISTAQDLPTKA